MVFDHFRVRATVNESVSVKKLAGSFYKFTDFRFSSSLHSLKAFCALLKVKSRFLTPKLSLYPSGSPFAINLNWLRISFNELFIGVADNNRTLMSSLVL